MLKLRYGFRKKARDEIDVCSTLIEDLDKLVFTLICYISFVHKILHFL